MLESATAWEWGGGPGGRGGGVGSETGGTEIKGVREWYASKTSNCKQTLSS